MGKGFSKAKKQAKQLQEQLTKMQEDMKSLEVSGSAGNGLVEITLSGDKDIKKITIHPDCIDPEDAEGLQDLILVAFNDASAKIQDNSPTSILDGLSMGNLPFEI